jgi:type IV pilus assembly protein PilB
VKYRIDGVLQPAMRPIDKRFHSTIISRDQGHGGARHRREARAAGRPLQAAHAGKTIDFRVSIMPSVHGEDAVIRILDKESISEQFTSCGSTSSVSRRRASRFRKYIASRTAWCSSPGRRQRQDDDAVCGAVGDQIDRRQDHHDRRSGRVPAARHHADSDQREERADVRRGLRSILRHDPDKIMVGEIRDAETAQIAINSALTGHLVFTTVHANNVLDVLGRFLNMGSRPISSCRP